MSLLVREIIVSVLGVHKNKVINFNILHHSITIELCLCYKRSLTPKRALYIEKKEIKFSIVREKRHKQLCYLEI